MSSLRATAGNGIGADPPERLCFSLGYGRGDEEHAMAEIDYDEWMSESDALMWHMERDPVLRSTITTVWVLDQAPDPERFEAALLAAINEVPRLRQRVIADATAIAPPKWDVDPMFDLSYHFRTGRVGGDGSLRDLLDQAAPIAMQAFDKARPLWELHLLEGMAEGRTGVVMKLHHAVSDGVGLVKMTGSFMELDRDAAPAGAGRETPIAADPDATHASPTRDAVLHQIESGLRRTGDLAAAVGKGAVDFAKDPRETAKGLAETAESIARSLRPVSEPMSPIMGDRSMSIHFDALRIEIDTLKRAGAAAGGTLNDAYVAAVLGGLARYHDHHGVAIDELRMTMPINVRPPGDEGKTAGNLFAPARFAVPLSIEDPIERMRRVHALVQEQRAEPAYAKIGGISAVLYGLGPAIFTRLTGSMLKAIDFVTSNVPGPGFPVYSAGALMERNIPFGPLSGAGANLTLYSYNGMAEIGINTDRAAVPDGEVFTRCLRESLEEFEALA
jgi:WS/DGAT/MGAT family acyltransferase